MNIVTQSISSQASYNYGNRIDTLTKQKQVSKYVNPQFRGGEQFIKTGVETVTNGKLILPKILMALGLTKLAYSIYTKPFKKELKSMQKNIDNNRSDIVKRDRIYCNTDFYKNADINETLLRWEKLDNILSSQQKAINKYKDEIISTKNLTKEEINSKFADLKLNISMLVEEYNQVHNILNNLEKARYEERVNKEFEVRKLIDEYKKTKNDSTRKKIEDEIGFSIKYHPYYAKGKYSSLTSRYYYDLPECITTTNGERPFTKYQKVIEGYYKSELVEHDYNYKTMPTKSWEKVWHSIGKGSSLC